MPIRVNNQLDTLFNAFISLLRNRVIYTRLFIDTIDSPDDEHWVGRNT